MSEILSLLTNPLVGGPAASAALYLITNAGAVGTYAQGLWAKVRSRRAGSASADVELEQILAAVRKGQVRALAQDAAVRTATLAECDSFAKTMRNLYGPPEASS